MSGDTKPTDPGALVEAAKREAHEAITNGIRPHAAIDRAIALAELAQAEKMREIYCENTLRRRGSGTDFDQECNRLHDAVGK